jgi:hypothetical protein
VSNPGNVSFKQNPRIFGVGGGVNPMDATEPPVGPPVPAPLPGQGGFSEWAANERRRVESGQPIDPFSPEGRMQEVLNPGTVLGSPVGKPEEELYGINAAGRDQTASSNWFAKQGQNFSEAVARYFAGQDNVDYDQGVGSQAYSTGDGVMRGSGSPAGEFANPLPETVEEEVIPTDWMAKAMAYQNQFAPDYSGIKDRYSDEANITNARIQAMYDQIASQAGENVQRVSDVYSGASEGIGSVYDNASANTQAAYSSSQQQAADQMARLGIQEAAPSVLNPAALSQAEAVANLEAGRGSGQAANERFGASAGGFASQMAQVAQQEGAQYQTGVADSLRRKMIDLDTRSQQEAYQRAMQAPGLAQSLEQASRIGQSQGPSLAQQEFDFRVGQAGAKISLDQQAAFSNRYQQLYDALGNDGEAAWEELQIEVARGAI